MHVSGKTVNDSVKGIKQHTTHITPKPREVGVERWENRKDEVEYSI